MYHMIKARGVISFVAEEAPAATCALGVAEMFYKFHSFTIECLAFLGTWCAFSWAFGRLWKMVRQIQHGGQSNG
jgi:hypothetical protein